MILKLTYRLVVLLLFCMTFPVLKTSAVDSPSTPNPCAGALNRLSEFRTDGIYGSPLEEAWHPVSIYKLIHRMRQLRVIEHEFRDASEDWTFEFVTFLGGKTVAFVWNRKILAAGCKGPNAFFVKKKD